MPPATNPIARFGINSYAYTLDHTAEQFLDRMSERGVTAVELMMYPGHLWPKAISAEARRALRQRAERLGIRVVSLNMPNIDVNIAAASEDVRLLSLDHLEQTIQLAGELGAAGVIIGPGKSNPLFSMPREQLMGHLMAALERLVPAARKAGTALWAENMPFAFLPKIDDLVGALDQFGSDEVKIIYDVANAYFVKEDLGYGLRKAAPRLALVHLSDTHQTVYRHDPVGLGSVPFATVPSILAEIGYTEPTMLEIIAFEADTQIEESGRRLVAAGF